MAIGICRIQRKFYCLVVTQLFLAGAAFTTLVHSEELSEYIPKKELKEFHFPLDKQYKEIWFTFYVLSYENDTIRSLVAAGAKIVPSTIAAIKDKKLYKRRYAIGALGYLNDRSAIPVLMEIIHDDKELDYFRGDALESLFQIDGELGKKEATTILADISKAKGELYHVRIAKRVIYEPNSIPKKLQSEP